ncbi:uncharacterized protein [Montipora foliosa]|uniref:uncharacterized protein isoform X2 n=1 Tax=Montipora foliosa TaxID=591990 RepID=UPI0035F13AA1
MVVVVHSALKLGQSSSTVRSRIRSRGYHKVDWQSATVVESVLSGKLNRSVYGGPLGYSSVEFLQASAVFIPRAQPFKLSNQKLNVGFAVFRMLRKHKHFVCCFSFCHVQDAAALQSFDYEE